MAKREKKPVHKVVMTEGKRQIMDTIAYYKRNAKIIYDGMTEAGYRAVGGINSPYIWVEVPEGMTSWGFFDKLLQVGMAVQDRDLLLPETPAFCAVRVACVAAERTVVLHLQVVSGIAVREQQFALLLCDRQELLLWACLLPAAVFASGETGPQIVHSDLRCLLLEGPVGRDLPVYLPAALQQLIPVAHLGLRISAHDIIVLFPCQ